MTFSAGQVMAVQGAFELAGYVGALQTLPVASEDERIFVLPEAAYLGLTGDVVVLQQELQQVLQLKVWVLPSVEDSTIPFPS